MRFSHGFSGLAIICAIVLGQTTKGFSQAFVSCEIDRGIHPTPSRLSFAASNHFIGPTSLTWSEVENSFEAVARAYSRRKLPSTARLKFSTTSTINAFVEGSHTITVTAGLLKTLSNTNELTFVLSHEMAHIALKHPHHSTHQMEQAADALATLILRDLNLNPCYSLVTLASIRRHTRLYSQSLQQRLAYLSRSSAADCFTSSSSHIAVVSLPAP